MTGPTGTPRLTRYSTGGGCACKLPQSLLADVLATVRGTGVLGAGGAGPVRDPALRVGLDPADDAAVYAIDETRAWVITCDFLTPVVDDARAWGRIAAANALSDVYAMGGRPLLTLNLLGWPAELGGDLLAAVLRGGAQAVAAAGALLVGGHSIVDPVPKYGLVAIGEVDPRAVLRKGGGAAGDALVLTKPLGVGVVGTAVKRGQAPAELVEAAVASMTRLNADAAAVAREAGLRGGTDVTGYGLIGHLHEMTLAAGLAARIDPGAVPRLPGVAGLLAAGCAPDGSVRTLDAALAAGWFDPAGLGRAEQVLLADAQTSGGLLLAVPPARAAGVVARLHEHGDTAAAVVGELVDGAPGTIAVAR
ncbi:selenide, water dikinase SelD [Pseudonocardia acidicola]|uniref:Selenide, water dikinase n=1 Tax=Pseudonocardia acidicola TaxID=2724939 RepID=A0ABX1SFF8_9PSEU|nr:selenide, water dikinase SelD [Pseudonocardia acidicola]NMI00286.1 selenide, water dikinase SelD [Pseudonocardia acidicola]